MKYAKAKITILSTEPSEASRKDFSDEGGRWLILQTVATKESPSQNPGKKK